MPPEENDEKVVEPVVPAAEAVIEEPVVAPELSAWDTIANFDEDADEPAPATVEGDQEVVAEVPAAPVEEVSEPVVSPPPATPEPVAPVPPVAPEPMQTEQELYDSRIATLTQGYALSDDDALALQTEPETVLPKLLAKMHYDMTQNVLQGVQAVIPQMITQQTTQAASDAEVKAAFFKEFPDLADEKYAPTILQIAKVNREMNPTSTREELITQVGNLSRVALKLVAPAAGGIPTPPVPLPAVRPKPFTPARGSGGAAQVKEVNEWEALANVDTD